MCNVCFLKRAKSIIEVREAAKWDQSHGKSLRFILEAISAMPASKPHWMIGEYCSVSTRGRATRQREWSWCDCYGCASTTNNTLLTTDDKGCDLAQLLSILVTKNCSIRGVASDKCLWLSWGVVMFAPSVWHHVTERHLLLPHAGFFPHHQPQLRQAMLMAAHSREPSLES